MPERLYREFRAHVAPPTEGARAAARSRLAAGAGHARPPASRSRRWALAVALSVAAGAALAVGWPTDRAGGDSVVERAAAALTPPPGRILHVRAEGHNIYTPWSEHWQTTTGPLRIRSRLGGSNAAGPCTIEWSYDAAERTMATWDASTRTIYWQRVDETTASQIGFPDPLREIRAHLAAGRLREAGRQTIDGRDVIRLEPAGGLQPGGEGREGDAVYAYAVDARTFQPVRWEISPTQWYDYTIYEYLPDDETARALLSLEAQHPGAPRIEGSPPDPARACNFG